MYCLTFGCLQVTEHTLKAFGVETCSDLLDQRGLMAALFTPISTDFFMRVGLALVSPALRFHSRLL